MQKAARPKRDRTGRDQSGRDQTVKGRPNRSVSNGAEERPFIAWDGEGINLAGAGKPQSYVLFGSTEDRIISKNGLTTIDCLEHIIETGQRNPGAFHVGFGFSYDTNMICKTLSETSLRLLHKNKTVKLKGLPYRISIRQGKEFTVTKYLAGYDREKNPKAKITVTIQDTFSFFAQSFLKAYEELVGEVPEEVRVGKARRSTFSLDEFEDVEKYWALEIQMMKELAEELRKRVYSAGLKITDWYGPGALATYAMRAHGIKSHMAVACDAVREAARFAYAGGRFELFKCGRISGRIYSYDINSAYPYAISKLPSLTNGVWVYLENPDELEPFGVYHVKLECDRTFDKQPGPLFHRDSSHNISFPWNVEGWYWTPEARIAKKMGAPILEGWVFRENSEIRPFDWIPEMFEKRNVWKKSNDPGERAAQLALKLCMNSCYGKLAQRVGWTPENNKIPPFHQLEWAGWVTSYVRAMLYSLMSLIPFDRLIAVETDGIFTTMAPEELPKRYAQKYASSDRLGGWKVEEYEEIIYVQSGLAWMRHPGDCDKKCKGRPGNGGWHEKRRGLDGCKEGHTPDLCDCEGTFSLNACRAFVESLHPMSGGGQPWPTHVGKTTRFVGMGQALMRKGFAKDHHCVWETTKRMIKAGGQGKRMHLYKGPLHPDEWLCDACEQGKNGLEMAHDLVVRVASKPMSTPHNIPWEDHDDSHVVWREQQDDEDGYVLWA